jgi:hypothetical protein
MSYSAIVDLSDCGDTSMVRVAKHSNGVTVCTYSLRCRMGLHGARRNCEAMHWARSLHLVAFVIRSSGPESQEGR